MRYTLLLPPTRAPYAIVMPSGEKYGPEWTLAVDVSRRAEPPSRGTVHTSSAYTKAMREALSAGARKMCGVWARLSEEPDETRDRIRADRSADRSMRRKFLRAQATAKQMSAAIVARGYARPQRKFLTGPSSVRRTAQIMPTICGVWTQRSFGTTEAQYRPP